MATFPKLRPEKRPPSQDLQDAMGLEFAEIDLSPLFGPGQQFDPDDPRATIIALYWRTRDTIAKTVVQAGVQPSLARRTVDEIFAELYRQFQLIERVPDASRERKRRQSAV